MNDYFAAGETLTCLKYIERKDGRASIRPGDKVKVLNEFKFEYAGEKCQDILVQPEHGLPMLVLIDAGVFARENSRTFFTGA